MLEDTIALINVSLEYFNLNETIASEPEQPTYVHVAHDEHL